MKRALKTLLLCLIGSFGATTLFLAMTSLPNFPIQFREVQTEGPNHSTWNQMVRIITDPESSMRIKSKYDIVNPRNNKDGSRRSTCPDILSGMSKGKWIRRTLTAGEQNTIDKYLQSERGAYKIPPTYQRGDGLCGDVPYENSPLYIHMWFKAICDPKGGTPCCQTNRCVALDEEQCRCPTCYDERQTLHVEYSQWQPEDDRCNVKNFTKEAACQVLNGTTLHFVGDSFIRHVFAALVIILTNSFDGALKKGIPPHVRSACTGMHQITGLVCREHLDEDRLLCEGTVKIKYTEVFPSREFSLMPPLLRTLRHVNKSIIVVSLGIHDNFNLRTVENNFLLPFLNLHQSLSTNLTFDLQLENVLMHFDDVDTSSSTTNKNDVKVNRTQGNESFKIAAPPYEKMILKDGISGIFNSNMNQLSRTLLSPMKNGFNLLGVNFRASKKYKEIMQKQNEVNYGRITQPISDKQAADNSSVTKNIQKNSTKIDFNITNSSIIFTRFPKPDLDNQGWPLLLWIGAHAPGLLKSPKFKEQSEDGVQSFNKGIHELLNRWKVPYLDTFGFTKGVVSFDGTHYGWGVNMLKVNMLLTLIESGALEEYMLEQ